MSVDPRARGEGAPDEGGAEDHDAEALEATGDVDGLLALARAYRSGTASGGRDMRKCYETYAAAARLGSADAEYAVALFLVNGGPVAQDLKEAATHLRVAAERGSVPAKVFLGNMYELGIHYKADPEKADVWYRNAARSAGVSAAPGTDAHTRELAELGCVRYGLAVIERGGVDEATKTRLLGRMRAHGHGVRVRTAEETADARGSMLPEARDAIEGALASAEGPAGKSPTAAAKPAATRPAEHAKDTKPASSAPSARAKAAGATGAADALAAFGYALLFLLAGVGAAYAAWHGARELVAQGTRLPGFGTRTDAVFGAVLGLVGVLPSLLVYRLGTVVKAIVAAGVLAGVGWVSWGTGQALLHAARPVQALGFALPGFAAALLVLGLVDGVKLGRSSRR